jgi:hypothetical protein
MGQSISLRITDAARTALLDFLRHCTPGAIVAVELSETDGQCAIGAFNKEKIPPTDVVAVSGIPFVFKENELAYFNGRTLDHRGGAFRVD